MFHTRTNSSRIAGTMTRDSGTFLSARRRINKYNALHK